MLMHDVPITTMVALPALLLLPTVPQLVHWHGGDVVEVAVAVVAGGRGGTFALVIQRISYN